MKESIEKPEEERKGFVIAKTSKNQVTVLLK